MATNGKRKELWSTVLLSVVMVAVVVWVGCKKQPAEQGGSGSGGSETSEKPLKTTTGLFTEPKQTLSEIIKAAKTWGPAFESLWGQAAPDFAATDMNGKGHKLSSYRGKDVLIIFWASNYSPCQLEMADLIELRNSIGENKLAMLAISREDPTLLKTFVAQNRINYTVVSQAGPLPSPFDKVEYVPSSFFVDRQGKIRLATVGKLSLNEIKAILQAG